MTKVLLDTDILSEIAATALRNGLSIVTGNVAHYEQVRSGGYDLYVENWRTG
jgi:predicted nucleic acid-binding protein